MVDDETETVTRSITLPKELEEDAVERFDGSKPTEALRQAVRAGVTLQDCSDDVSRLIEVLHALEVDDDD